MYRMTKWEFQQYVNAETQLALVTEEHKLKIQELYDAIHPSIVFYDSELGSAYSRGINTADYAIYIADLKAEHKREEDFWRKRVRAYKKAISYLSREEYRDYHSKDINRYESARKMVLKHLSEIVAAREDLQFSKYNIKAIEQSMDEYDEMIEKMSKSELLEDYTDYIGENEPEKPASLPSVSLEEKKALVISPVVPWKMHESERLAYVKKYPIVRKPPQKRWFIG